MYRFQNKQSRTFTLQLQQTNLYQVQRFLWGSLQAALLMHLVLHDVGKTHAGCGTPWWAGRGQALPRVVRGAGGGRGFRRGWRDGLGLRWDADWETPAVTKQNLLWIRMLPALCLNLWWETTLKQVNRWSSQWVTFDERFIHVEIWTHG